MCRLYGLRSTHQTRVGCELIDAQNSLIRQSVEDERGLSNPHGWGLGYWRDGSVSCERQVGPASQSEAFRRYAAQMQARTMLAHVRRATVGKPKLVNTHPFLADDGMLAHNGHIDHFEKVRERMLAELPTEFEEQILGDTDSEHFFQLLRYRQAEQPGLESRHIIHEAIRDVHSWAREIDSRAEVALNVLWTEGRNLAGARFGRGLYYVERDEPRRCPVCGQLHSEPAPDDPYFTVELASEPITPEEWREVPEGTAFDVGPDRDFDRTPIDV